MSESIQFRATVDAVQTGDDELRLVLAVEGSTEDLAAATSMIGKRNRVLHISARIGSDTETLAEFRGAIAQMNTGLQFRANKPPLIKLNVPASDAIKAALLIGYTEQVIRFEITDDGEQAKKARKERQPKARTPFGDMWQELLHRDMGFEHIPVINAALESVRSSVHEDPHLLMQKVFGVGSLSRLIGPDEIRARFPHTEVTGMVRQAVNRLREQQLG